MRSVAEASARITPPLRSLRWAPATTPQALQEDTACEFPERFVVLRGPTGPARLFRIDHRDAITIGRNSTCGIVVNDAYCSRVHCKLVELGGEWLLVHLSRTNSTRVNGRNVSTTCLQDGDRIQIGHSELAFSVVPPTAEEPLSHDAG